MQSFTCRSETGSHFFSFFWAQNHDSGEFHGQGFRPIEKWQKGIGYFTDQRRPWDAGNANHHPHAQRNNPRSHPWTGSSQIKRFADSWTSINQHKPTEEVIGYRITITCRSVAIRILLTKSLRLSRDWRKTADHPIDRSLVSRQRDGARE